MFCRNCGAALADNAAVCSSCGTAVTPIQPANEAPAAAPQQPVCERIVTNVIPEENRPLSPWAYFGLQLLFAIPIVGFVFLIVFSCNGSNINRRNFARSYWCSLVIAAIVFFVVFLLVLMSGNTAHYI